MRTWLLGLTYTVSGDGMIAATKAAADAGVDLASMDPIDVIRAGPLCMADGARLKDAFVYRRRCPLGSPMPILTSTLASSNAPASVDR